MAEQGAVNGPVALVGADVRLGPARRRPARERAAGSPPNRAALATRRAVRAQPEIAGRAVFETQVRHPDAVDRVALGAQLLGKAPMVAHVVMENIVVDPVNPLAIRAPKEGNRLTDFVAGPRGTELDCVVPVAQRPAPAAVRDLRAQIPAVVEDIERLFLTITELQDLADPAPGALPLWGKPARRVPVVQPVGVFAEAARYVVEPADITEHIMRPAMS